jgi:iron complex outermembrane recepter protein
MNSTGKSIVALTATAVAATGYVGQVAQAEDLTEVVVVARKRDESFRDVPMTVNVFTEKAIESAGISKPGDFIAMIPNMSLVETQNAGNAFVVVRGISQARNSEPSVAVLVDGVLETNPSEFNQELFDIKQIEVLKGPQGALYGRSAIGGAILIRTQDPGDSFQGRAKVGIGNGSTETGQLAVSGPIDAAKTLKYRASVSYSNTDGFLENTYLKEKADPARNYSGRVRLNWEPSDQFSGDFRIAYDRLETRGFYFVVPRKDNTPPTAANPFPIFSFYDNANDTTTPITVNNRGVDNRDVFNTSLKLEFQADAGTVTLISAYDKTREIVTGDAFDFRPADQSFFRWLPNALNPANPPWQGTDENQSQFLDTRAYSQEVRFTAKPVDGFSWLAGAYYVHTDRFIATSNMYDTGAGVFPVYRTPRLTGPNANASFLADTQANEAWAVFADATYQFAPAWELDAAVRYDEDTRKNTTNTPTQFLPDPTAVSGEVRKHTWSQMQPKGTLRYKPSEQVTFYGGWSRGFRSGGFNQTGVGAVAKANNILGVNDLFNAEVADTWEVGMKSTWLDRRVNVGVALFDTKSKNGYFFNYLAATGTQNLGNLDATFKGGELEVNARLSDNFDLNASYGYTDSHIDRMADPTVIGKQAPLVSRSTINAGIQYHQPVGDNLTAVARLDYQQIGRTWWSPDNATSRNPVDLVDARLGVEGQQWSLTAWSKNLTDTKYNSESSPGGFLWRALPRRYGIEFGYKF